MCYEENAIVMNNTLGCIVQAKFMLCVSIHTYKYNTLRKSQMFEAFIYTINVLVFMI